MHRQKSPRFDLRFFSSLEIFRSAGASMGGCCGSSGVGGVFSGVDVGESGSVSVLFVVVSSLDSCVVGGEFVGFGG